MTKKRKVIRMDGDLHKKLKVLAARLGESISDLADQAIAEFINKKGEKP